MDNNPDDNDPSLEDLLDRYLPPDWNDSPSRKRQIKAVVRTVLKDTDTNAPIHERRNSAQHSVAAKEDVSTNTIQSKCGRETWNGYVSNGDRYQRDHFDAALEKIEAAWNGGQSDLSTLLYKGIKDYPVDKIGQGMEEHTVRNIISQNIPHTIQSLLSDDELTVEGSTGKGRWTSIPWVAIMDRRETDQIQDGLYVVYLFEPQERRVTLTLNQGVTELKNEHGTKKARNELRSKASEIQEVIEPAGFEPGPIDFPHASNRNKLYGPGTIYYKRYSLGDLSDTATVDGDLRRLVATYQRYISDSNSPDLSEYWQQIQSKRDLALKFLSNPTQQTLSEWFNACNWTLGRFGPDVEELLNEVSAKDFAGIVQNAAESGAPGDLLKLDGVGITFSSELLAAVAPGKFVILNEAAANGVAALGGSRPNPNTTSVDRYDDFVSSVRDLTQRYDLRSFVGEVPTWATPLEVATFAFYEHDKRNVDLSELAPTDLRTEIQDLLEAESKQARLYRQATAHLIAGKNVVFYGPPGTGKTRAANLLTDTLCASRSLVTANAEWSNYQVVGGYKPAGESWEPQAGFLTTAARDCAQTLSQKGALPSWLIIDELNRANLDEAFGDVFTLLDIDYRTHEPIKYAGCTQPVPLSFRILATMNTYDQAQLFSLGYAFRRRFAFVDVPSLLDTYDPSKTSIEAESIPAVSPTLDEAYDELVDIVKNAAIESLSVGANGSGVHENDVAAVVPEFADEERLSEAVEALRENSDLQTDGLSVFETIVYFAYEIYDRDVIDVGQALLIDIAKYLIAHQLMFPDRTSRETLDEAVVAYIAPQFEYFMSELRRAETIDRDSDAVDRFNQLITLASDLNLPHTAAVLQDAADSKRLLS